MSLEDLSNEDILNNKEVRWPKFCLDLDIWNFHVMDNRGWINDWQEVKFFKENQKDIPGKQGIYMFIARLDVENITNTNHSYILYVGQAKDLRKRFGNYFDYKQTTHPSDQLKRKMILIWENFLFFNFITTDYSKKELTDFEYQLIDTIVPPMNNQFRAKLVKKYVDFYAPR